MLMEVLDCSPDTDVYHERDPRAFTDYLMRNEAVIENLINTSPSNRIVIKALCESHKVYHLLTKFAPSRAIWMFRHYSDQVNSYLTSWPGGRNQLEDIITDRYSAGWRGLGMTDATHRIVTEHYHPELNDASAIALFWYYRNQLFFDQGLDRRSDVYLANYERFVSDPEGELERISAFLEITLQSSVAAMISRSSVRKRETPCIEPRIMELCEAMYGRLEDSTA
jgi:hypothetical protein